MATIGIKGIRLDTVTLSTEDDQEKISGGYSLISTADKVLAKQSVGGYQGMDIKPSPGTIKAMRDFILAYKNDIQMVLGLDAQ
jgi:hypothetical protein